MSYKFKVWPTLAGVLIALFLTTIGETHGSEVPVAYGMSVMLILMGITKQAEWY